MGFPAGLLKQAGGGGPGGGSGLGGLIDTVAKNPQLLAGALPTVIDQLTPDGNIPEASARENTLSSLLSRIGGQTCRRRR